MRVVPERSLWLQMVTWLGAFALGPLLAVWVSTATTPNSELVQILGPFGFAAVFAGGTLLWMGLGIAAVVARALWSLGRGRVPEPPPRARERMVPPGYRSYVVLGFLAGIVLGVLAGVATELTLPVATALWTLAGVGYGVLLWLAAHHGYLPFPEPE